MAFPGFGADEDEKVKTTQNIITLVRTAQQHKVPIDYDGIVKSAEDTFGVDHPEVEEVRTLINSLKSTNPY
jgi:hypothetical protein